MSGREGQLLCDLICLWNLKKKPNIIEMESSLVVTRVWMVGKFMKVAESLVSSYKTKCVWGCDAWHGDFN